MLKKTVVFAGALAAVIAVGAGIFAVAHGFGGRNTAAINNKKIIAESSSGQAQSAKPQVSSKSANSSSSVTPADVSSPDYTPSSKHRIAYLTFDDGPSTLTPGLLDILKKNNVKATFFVVALGKDTPELRRLIKTEAADGNTIGIHSWTHDYSYIYSSEANFLYDFNKMRSIIISAAGVTPEVSRFPGGIGNTVNMRYNRVNIMPKLVKDVESMGVTPFDWNAGAIDAVFPVPTKQQIVDAVVSQCRYLDNAVILLHDSDGHESSIEAVPEIITKLRAMGFNFETLSPKSRIVQEPFAKRRVTSSSSVPSKPSSSAASSQKPPCSSATHRPPSSSSAQSRLSSSLPPSSSASSGSAQSSSQAMSADARVQRIHLHRSAAKRCEVL